MKLINKFKSPNYNNRSVSNIKYIIIHYTALENTTEALSYLCNPIKKVSCHFLISQRGTIYNLVNEKKRAWHAGKSFWNDDEDINSLSIGIELDYSFKFKNNKFTNQMMQSLQILIKYLRKKYKIFSYNVLGHSDIAPLRKQDPGKSFPWYKLTKLNLVFHPSKQDNLKIIFLKKWFKKNGFKTNKQISIFILRYIGYETKGIFENRYNYKKILIAYQSRYLKYNISGKADLVTLTKLYEHMLSLLLTKK